MLCHIPSLVPPLDFSYQNTQKLQSFWSSAPDPNGGPYSAWGLDLYPPLILGSATDMYWCVCASFMYEYRLRWRSSIADRCRQWNLLKRVETGLLHTSHHRCYALLFFEVLQVSCCAVLVLPKILIFWSPFVCGTCSILWMLFFPLKIAI